MALVLADRVKETTTTTGTTDFVLSGADTGFQTFSAGVGANNTTYYAVALGSDFEIGLGTLSSDGLTLARTTVLQSSNSDNKVSFAAGSKYVFVTYPADKAVLTDATQTLTNKTLNSPTFVTPVLGTPSSGTLTNCTFPTLNQNTTGTASNVTGTVAIANGGTGATTRQDAMDALAGSTTSGQYLRGNGTDVVMAAIQAGDVPTLNQNTTGTASNVTGTVAVANGGTGQTSYTDGQLLIGNSTGNTLSKATLTAGTNITITNAAGAITIAASGGGASAATPTALGTVYGKQTTVGGTPYLTAYGYNAGSSTTGVGVTAVGTEALYTNSAGARSTAMGYRAGYSNTGDNNLFVGNQSGFTNTTGTGNSFVGGMNSANWPPGYYNTTGSDNSAFGGGALRANTTGSYNTAIGTDALHLNTTASQGTAVGYQAAYNNTTGAENTAVGYQALKANTTGYNSVAVGRATLLKSNGNQNTAVGSNAMYENTSGINNAAVGQAALYENTTGSYNSAFGQSALNANTTGANNTAVGYQAGYSVTSGYRNTLIGFAAGYYGSSLTTGAYNTLIGQEAALNAGTDNYCLVLSTNAATGKGGSTGFIWAGGGGIYQGNNSSTWSTTSDQRLKKNIVNNDVGLEKLTQIQVRNFEYRLPEEVTDLPKDQAIQKTGVQLGVIAQELQAVLPECVKTESTGVLSVDTDNLTWYLINAVKELKAEVDSLKSQLNLGA